MTHWLDRLKLQAVKKPRRVLLPESNDERVCEAAKRLVAERLAIPIFLSESQTHIPGCEVLDQADDWPQCLTAIEQVIEQRLAKKGEAAVAEAKADPLMHCAVALHLGYVDAAVAGAATSTGDVLRCGLRGVGLAENASLMSSSFIMDWQDKTISMGDCAVVPEPDTEQLAQIALASAKTFTSLTGQQARVALLSFSTLGSGSGESVDIVRQATDLLRQLAPDLLVEGEIQFDAAFVPEIGQRKASGSDVAGQANVFVFPDLNAGNIGYKIAERMGGARATGPILSGFAKPWMDLSRGCSVETIVNMSVIAGSLAAD